MIGRIPISLLIRMGFLRVNVFVNCVQGKTKIYYYNVFYVCVCAEINKVVCENPQRLEQVVNMFVRSGVKNGKGGEVAVALRRLMIEGTGKGYRCYICSFNSAFRR